jgi:environmental stress-induced protein Ves
MPTPRVIRFAPLEPSAWANGRGTTVELFRSPLTGDFDVRLSIATVGEAAPFSPLPGIDRALMPLAPEGLAVAVGGTPLELARFEVLRFAGEDPIVATGGEPGYDLNLMVRRGCGSPVLQHVSVDGRYESPAATIATVVLDGTLTALGVVLGFGDTVVGGPVAVRGVGDIAIVSLS